MRTKMPTAIKDFSSNISLIATNSDGGFLEKIEPEITPSQI